MTLTYTTPISRTDDDPQVLSPQKVDRKSEVAIGVFALIVGVGLRLFLWRHATLTYVDGDEAVVGMMARHMITHHQFPAFFWHQYYGGTLEPAASALMMLILGKTAFALKMGTLLFAIGTYVTTYFVAREWVSRKAAITAAAITAVGNGYFVWWSTKARGFYWAALFFGMVTLYIAEKLKKAPASVRLWAFFGLAVGLGWWQSPQILFFAIPSALYMFRDVRQHLKASAVAIPMFLLGSLPWIISNFQNSLGSLKPPPGQPHSWHVISSTFGAFFRHGIPATIGTETGGQTFVDYKLPIAIVIMLYALFRAYRTKDKSPLALYFMLTFPFVYALIVSEGTGAGRYVVFLIPVVSILLVSQISRTWFALALITAISVVSAMQLEFFEKYSFDGAGRVQAPVSTKIVQDYLQANHESHFYAPYAVAQRITLQSNEKLIGIPLDTNSTRYQPYKTIVQHDPKSVYVFVKNGLEIALFMDNHPDAGSCFSITDLKQYLVYTPVTNC